MFVWCGRNQRHTKNTKWGGTTEFLVPCHRFCMILVTGRRVSQEVWSHRIDGGWNILPGRWFMPCNRAHFLVFERQLDEPYRSSHACLVQKKSGGGAAG